jgi:hypothetical protein
MRDFIVEKLVNILSPMLELDDKGARSGCQTPRLSADRLGLDKREMAGLIVERIFPLLPAIDNNLPLFDTDAIMIITKMRRVIGAFEIKEQVADLVVGRFLFLQW